MERVELVLGWTVAVVVVVVGAAFVLRRVLAPEQRWLRQQRRRKRQYLRRNLAHLEKPTSGSDTHPGGAPDVP